MVGRQNAMEEIRRRNEDQHRNRAALVEFTDEWDWLYRCHKMGNREIIDLVERCKNGMQCISGGRGDGNGRTFDACIPTIAKVDRESIREATGAAIEERFARWNPDPRRPDFAHWIHHRFGKKRR